MKQSISSLFFLHPFVVGLIPGLQIFTRWICSLTACGSEHQSYHTKMKYSYITGSLHMSCPVKGLFCKEYSHILVIIILIFNEIMIKTPTFKAHYKDQYLILTENK